MAIAHPQGTNHQGKFRDLGEVQRGQDAQPGRATQPGPAWAKGRRSSWKGLVTCLMKTDVRQVCRNAQPNVDSNLQMPSQHVLTTATSTAAHVDQQENAQPAKEQHGAGHEQGGQNGFEGWHGNLHSQGGKEERDEKVADVFDLSCK